MCRSPQKHTITTLGRGLKSRSSCRVGTLSKSFTHSCLFRFGVKLLHSIRAVSGAPLSSCGLEEIASVNELDLYSFLLCKMQAHASLMLFLPHREHIVEFDDVSSFVRSMVQH